MIRCEGYKTIRLSEGFGLVREASAGRLKLTDAVVFDCDGVLIDSRQSYDRAIELTVSYFSSRLLGREPDVNFPIRQCIEILRRTGQFNNDIDATAAIILAIAVGLSEDIERESDESTSGDVTQPRYYDKSAEAVERKPTTRKSGSASVLANRVLGLLETAQDGFSSMGSRLKERHPSIASQIDELLRQLAYPGSPASSQLSRVFNEYYYGPSLATRLYGISPTMGLSNGLIDSERIIVTQNTLRSLASMLSSSKIGIVSGRSMLGTRYTLGELFNFFRQGPTLFLEDHDATLDRGQPIPGKPAPDALLTTALTVRGCRTILYVGDSMEDLLMTRNANLRRPMFAFCAVTALTSNDSKMFLAKQGADAILDSVNDLPALLSSVR